MKKRTITVSADEIQADPAFQHYQDKHDLAEKTWAGYISALQRYVEYSGKSLSELIAEAELESENISLEKRRIGDRLRGFRTHLKDKHLSPGSVRKIVAAVKSFYTNGFSITIPSLGRDRSLSAKIKIENKGLPPREDIMKVLKIADAREKFIVLALSSSGLSTTDFITLTIKEVKEGYDKETGITVLDMRRRKTTRDFVTYLSGEATTALYEYLQWRERAQPITTHKDILSSWQKHRIYSDDDYLICQKQITNEFLDDKNEELRKESEYGIQTVFRSLASRAGISRDINVWNMFRAHKLRSWFFSTLINAGCPKEHAEVFMGHSSRIGSSAGTYYNVIPDKLKETYLEYMPHLSLLTPVEVRIIETEGYRVLTAKNVMLEKKLVKLESREEAVNSKAAETERLWAAIDELKKKFAPYTEDEEGRAYLERKLTGKILDEHSTKC